SVLPSEEGKLFINMKSFGYTTEDIDRVLEPMITEAKEPVGSMGDDTPLSVFSVRPRLLYTYFKQRFAQVTNPPIDPIRERCVMSLVTLIGPRGQLLEDTKKHARLIKLESPILTDASLEWLKNSAGRGFLCKTLSALFDAQAGEKGLNQALANLCDRAIAATDEGHTILIISDRGTCQSKAPIPMLLAAGAVHHRLVREGKRMRVSLVVET